MSLYHKKNQGLPAQTGYVAVISAIIITAVVFMIALVFSSSNFSGRFDSQSLEIKDVSRKVAEGCLEYARLKLAEGAYGGNEIRTIGGYNCYIAPIENISSQYIIKATSTISGKESRLKLTVHEATLKTISFEEY